MKSAPQMDGRAAPESHSLLERRALSPEEARRMLIEWNAPEAPYPEEKRVHQLFEELAARTPGRSCRLRNASVAAEAEKKKTNADSGGEKKR